MHRIFVLAIAAALIGCAPTPPPLPPVVAWEPLNQPVPPVTTTAQPIASAKAPQ